MNRTITGLITLFFLTACGGGGGSTLNDSTNNGKNRITIPDTAAKAPISPPVIVDPPLKPTTNEVVLKHIYRDTLKGEPTDGITHSPNVRVEVRQLGVIYDEIIRQSNGEFRIPLEDNGLAYFRVVNIKPNGKKRVHLFYGVEPGYFTTLDSTDIAITARQTYPCVEVKLRIIGLDSNSTPQHIQVNSQHHDNLLVQANQGYLKEASLCPVNEDVYFALVTEQVEQSTNYGFAFYRGLKDEEIIEVAIQHEARTIPWQSNLPTSGNITLAALAPQWRAEQPLFSITHTENDETVATGRLPVFDALDIKRYIWSGKSGQGTQRFPFSPNSSLLQLKLQNLTLDQVTQSPLEFSWQYQTEQRADIVSGIAFDSTLTQTYAFVSQDPSVLSAGNLTIPVQDLTLLADTLVFGMHALKAQNKQALDYQFEASTLAGIIRGTQSDAQSEQGFQRITRANNSELLNVIIEWLESQSSLKD